MKKDIIHISYSSFKGILYKKNVQLMKKQFPGDLLNSEDKANDIKFVII